MKRGAQLIKLKHLKDGKGKQNRGKSQENEGVARENKRENRNKICFGCGEEGHYKANCVERVGIKTVHPEETVYYVSILGDAEINHSLKGETNRQVSIKTELVGGGVRPGKK